MAGILDNKKRIMDTIVTQEGRRQLSSGKFKIEYVSFTDGNVFYEEDLSVGATDATKRIPFEAVNKFQDNIVFETDDSGNLLSYKGYGIELNSDGTIAIEDSESSDPVSTRTKVSSAEGFSTSVDSITSASFDSFKQQNFITTKKNRTDKGIAVFQNKDFLSYTLNSGYDNEVIKSRNVDTLPAFVNDVKLSNVLNFKFLPPLNDNDGTNNGEYADLNASHDLTSNEIKDMIKNKDVISCSITSSDIDNKIIFQIFESVVDEPNVKVNKLDMIDAGEFNIDGVIKRIVFAGKVLIDNFNQPTFVNMFTIEVSSDD